MFRSYGTLAFFVIARDEAISLCRSLFVIVSSLAITKLKLYFLFTLRARITNPRYRGREPHYRELIPFSTQLVIPTEEESHQVIQVM
jgi:hypothetical protein